jgi:hypothetical protein
MSTALMWSKFNSLLKCSSMGCCPWFCIFPVSTYPPTVVSVVGWAKALGRSESGLPVNVRHSNNTSTQEEPDSVVGTVTSLWAGHSEVWFSRSSSFFPSPKHPHQLWGSPSGHRGSFPGFKQLGCGADHSLPPIAKADIEWCHTAIPHILLHGEHKDRCTF